jgi:iron(III) transport system substrate-binding protein
LRCIRPSLLARPFAALTFLLAAASPVAAETLVVYSARNEQLIKPVFDQYTRETVSR